MNRKIQAIIGACIGLGVACFLIFKIVEWNPSSESDIRVRIVPNSEYCPVDTPVSIAWINFSKFDVVSIKFAIRVYDAGHSTRFYARNALWGDRIVKPHEFYAQCFAMPSFNDKDGIPIFDVPQSLVSPQYEIEVEDVRFGNEES